MFLADQYVDHYLSLCQASTGRQNTCGVHGGQFKFEWQVGHQINASCYQNFCDLCAANDMRVIASGHGIHGGIAVGVGVQFAGSARHLGLVKTGVAVKSGTPWPQVETAEQLKAAMLAAAGIYFPDPQLATAGIHLMKVLNGLGIADTVASKLRPYPNGNAAMNAMAACDDPHVIGCTQVTEILITQGVDLVANLPLEFELATLYTAGVRSTSTCAAEATAMIDILISKANAALRASGGFLPLA